MATVSPACLPVTYIVMLFPHSTHPSSSLHHLLFREKGAAAFLDALQFSSVTNTRRLLFFLQPQCCKSSRTRTASALFLCLWAAVPEAEWRMREGTCVFSYCCRVLSPIRL